MPRHYRISADTGMKEYDDSCEPYQGTCPICKTKHFGNFNKCDDCIEYEEEQAYKERQAYLDSLEDEEF